MSLKKIVEEEFDERFKDIRTPTKLFNSHYQEKMYTRKMFLEKGISASIANAYPQRWDSQAVYQFVSAECPATFVEKCANTYTYSEIIISYCLKIPIEKVRKSVKKMAPPMLKDPNDWRVLCVNDKSVVLDNLCRFTGHNLIIKFGHNLRKEATYFANSLKNIEMLSPRDKKVGYSMSEHLEIIYMPIIGRNLQENLELSKKNTYLPSEVLHLGKYLLQNLVDMRIAGIYYHRDLRPANIILIDDGTSSMIIDYGIASTDRHALSKNNRRFGYAKGKVANDLVSVGQILYYLATGKHIFEQSQSMTKTFSDIAEEINDYRTKVYSDKTGKLLKYHLRQIGKNIIDENVRVLIEDCLTAKHYQYNKIYKKWKLPNSEEQCWD